jgi:hypothetical protein
MTERLRILKIGKVKYEFTEDALKQLQRQAKKLCTGFLGEEDDL